VAQPNRLQVALFLLRITLGLFLLIWSIDKIVAPEATVKIFSHFYHLDISLTAARFVGAAQIVLSTGIIIGAYPTLTYGLGTLLHGISTASTYKQLLDPFGDNHLFVAAVPVLGAFVALFLLRDKDRWGRIRPGR